MYSHVVKKSGDRATHSHPNFESKYVTYCKIGWLQIVVCAFSLITDPGGKEAHFAINSYLVMEIFNLAQPQWLGHGTTVLLL
jgi:hypothetical protein